MNEKGTSIDLENAERQQPRRMSRIDKPISAVDDSGSDVDIGALIEAEKDHAIKYRTCSWQKVR